jgi:hypothetical protein
MGCGRLPIERPPGPEKICAPSTTVITTNCDWPSARRVMAITKCPIWVQTVNRFTVAERALTVSVAAYQR